MLITRQVHVRLGSKTGKAHREHMFSALPPRTDIERPVRHVRFVPRRDSCAAANQHLYSITSSARASSAGGMMTPSAFAVFKLITRSNLVGCSTGRSAGFAPLNILSAKPANRR